MTRLCAASRGLTQIAGSSGSFATGAVCVSGVSDAEPADVFEQQAADIRTKTKSTLGNMWSSSYGNGVTPLRWRTLNSFTPSSFRRHVSGGTSSLVWTASEDSIDADQTGAIRVCRRIRRTVSL